MYLGVGGMVAAALALASAMAFALTRRMLRPIQDLAAMAMEIARGRFGAQAAVHRRDEIGGLAEVFNYMSQQLLAFDSETRRLYESLEEGYLETMLVLAHSIDTKDSYTHGHSRRVGELAAEIGRELGLPQFELRQLMYGGLLHDIGKIGVVDPILHKNSKLTTEEMDLVRAHPVVGATILEGASFLRPVLPAVRHHHERWDGTGYPDGLEGEAIPLAARIIGAADTWDACTSIRPYQSPMAPEQALEVVHQLRGRQLDPRVADALERVVRLKIARGAEAGAAAESPRSHA
jgi:putative nucleotidyltransferase with HDIG domain